MSKSVNGKEEKNANLEKKSKTVQFFEIRQQGIIGMFLDLLMWPIMQVLMGSWRESAQRTHFWNNTSFDTHAYLNQDMMVKVDGIKGEIKKGLFRFHAPLLGGWRNYVVLSVPKSIEEWHIGWVVNDGKNSGYSTIPLTYLQNEVRVLIGPGDVSFFAFQEVYLEEEDDDLWPSLFERTVMVKQAPLFLVGIGVTGKTKKHQSVALR